MVKMVMKKMMKMVMVKMEMRKEMHLMGKYKSLYTVNDLTSTQLPS